LEEIMGRPEKYQLLPELLPEQFEALKADIAKRGAIVPVLLDEYGAIIDGHSRARACRELGINDYPVEVRSGLAEPEKRALARNLNALRRHLTRGQLRALIADQLRDTPAWSNRRISEGLGVDDKTVASVRAELAATAEIPQLEKTVGADGKARRAPAKRRQQYPNDLLDDEEQAEDGDEADEDEGAAPDSKQEKARWKEEAEQRRADKEWEAFGATAEKRAKMAHAVDLIELGADPNSEKVVKLLREATLATITSPPGTYDPLHGRTEVEKREWHLFILFLTRDRGSTRDALQSAAQHTEWLLQRPFQNVAEWLGEDGDKWRKRQGMRPIPPEVNQSWATFAAEHAGRPFTDITAELEKLAA
jgi:ParB-like chromosome segregation protein Spo0J